MCSTENRLGVRLLIKPREPTIIDSSTIPVSRHGVAVQQLCPHATEVVRRLQKAGYEAYIVGGSVRDLLVGKVPKDFDVATDATPEEIKVVFPRCHLIGRRFRLAHVRMNRVLVEVATFRGPEREPDDDRTHANGLILRDNVWGTLEQDALRRDFTINALFMDPVTGDIKDFVGGYEDLAARKLKLIGDPETRYREDPVRLLRAARFVAKLGVEMDAGTAAPMQAIAPMLDHIPPARLFEEVCKLFLTGHAVRTLETLQRFELTCSLFPVLKGKGRSGKAEISPLLRAAMVNTDKRVREDRSVTPAFLYAALLWQPVKDRADRYQEEGMTELDAIELASDEVLAMQVGRTALPRRFSSVTRQIWSLQVRLRKTRGKRAMRVMLQQRFRAAYDFLLLRAEESEELAVLCEFWTRAQENAVQQPEPSRRRRPRRRRKPKSSQGS